MALHTTLPIYKAAYDLLDAVTDLTAQFPRNFRASMGEQIRVECVRAITQVARANSVAPRDRGPHLVALLEGLEVIEVLTRLAKDKRFISVPQYTRLVAATGTIGKQANGWRKASAHA